jgi:hypothetical protein
MKNIFLFFVAIGLVLALAGCGPVMSLFPLRTAEDKLFDEQLLGEWRQVDPDKQKTISNEAAGDEHRWTFTRAGDGSGYDVKVLWTDKKKKDGLISSAHLVQLGNFLFIDFQGYSGEEDGFGYHPFPVVNAHMLARIRLQAAQKSLRIDFLKDDWIRNQIKAGKPVLATLDTDENLLVTATTQELRKFALAHAEDTEAFSEGYSFERVK